MEKFILKLENNENKNSKYNELDIPELIKKIDKTNDLNKKIKIYSALSENIDNVINEIIDDSK